MERTGGGHKATVLMGAWAMGILIDGESAVFVMQPSDAMPRHGDDVKWPLHMVTCICV